MLTPTEQQLKAKLSIVKVNIDTALSLLDQMDLQAGANWSINAVAAEPMPQAGQSNMPFSANAALASIPEEHRASIQSPDGSNSPSEEVVPPGQGSGDVVQQ